MKVEDIDIGGGGDEMARGGGGDGGGGDEHHCCHRPPCRTCLAALLCLTWSCPSRDWSATPAGGTAGGGGQQQQQRRQQRQRQSIPPPSTFANDDSIDDRFHDHLRPFNDDENNKYSRSSTFDKGAFGIANTLSGCSPRNARR